MKSKVSFACALMSMVFFIVGTYIIVSKVRSGYSENLKLAIGLMTAGIVISLIGLLFSFMGRKEENNVQKWTAIIWNGGICVLVVLGWIESVVL